MAVIFILGILISAAAPLLRRRHSHAAIALVAGAGTLIVLALLAFVHPNLRAGEAAVEENWRFALLTLGCEVPVLALALISLRAWKWAFWAGWIIHIAFTLWLIVVFVWLSFFWHW
jgi:hypothetical protein